MKLSFWEKSRKELTGFINDTGSVRFLEDQFLKVSREAYCKDDVLHWVWESIRRLAALQEEPLFGELFSSQPEILPDYEPGPGQVPDDAPSSAASVHTPLGKRPRPNSSNLQYEIEIH
jgi:hypothetical protein